MLKHMRTTIILPDELFRQVKERVHAEGRTFTSYLEALLRSDLARSHDHVDEEDPDVFILKPFHGTGVRPGVDLSSNASVLDVLDEGVPLEKLR